MDWLEAAYLLATVVSAVTRLIGGTALIAVGLLLGYVLHLIDKWRR